MSYIWFIFLENYYTDLDLTVLFVIIVFRQIKNTQFLGEPISRWKFTAKSLLRWKSLMLLWDLTCTTSNSSSPIYFVNPFPLLCFHEHFPSVLYLPYISKRPVLMGWMAQGKRCRKWSRRNIWWHLTLFILNNK